jgi:hypothetical protein
MSRQSPSGCRQALITNKKTTPPGPVLARTTPTRELERAALCSSDPCAVLGRLVPVPQGRDCQRCGDHHSCHCMSPVPANANEPSREEHTRSQPRATTKSNSSTTCAQPEAVMSSDQSLTRSPGPVVKRTARHGTSTKPEPNGSLPVTRRDTGSPANPARASAAADPEMSLTAQ